ncbi:MAG: phosphoglucosamine mutase [Metallosphaera sp.]
MGKLFGTDGVRGVVNQELTIELAQGLGKAIGTFFGEGSVLLIGRDARAGGDMITRAVESGLLSTGVRVYEGGFAPTPALQYAVKTLGYDGGVIITASHNPRGHNGIKVLDKDGVEVDREKEDSIEEIFFSSRFNLVSWNKLTYDVMREDKVIDTYVKGILSHVNVEKIRSKNFKVLIDGANSVGSISTPLIARLLGCRVYTLNANLEPTFPARNPEPTMDTLKESAQVSANLGVDITVAHDGDADRAIFVDSRGRIQWGDRSGALLSWWASKKEDFPRRIFTAVSSSSLVQEFLSKFGIEVIWTKVGSVDIARKLIQEKGIAGFEENGGFIFPLHQYVRDGAMSFALMLEMMAEEGVSSAELFDRLPQYHLVKSKVDLKPGMDVGKIYATVEREFGSGNHIVKIDGIKIISKDFWILVRKSGTEPIIRVMVEAKDQDVAEGLSKKVISLIGGSS